MLVIELFRVHRVLALPALCVVETLVESVFGLVAADSPQRYLVGLLALKQLREYELESLQRLDLLLASLLEDLEFLLYIEVGDIFYVPSSH